MKKTIAIVLAAILLTMFGVNAAAASSNDQYTYEYDYDQYAQVVASPDFFTEVKKIRGTQWDIGNFVTPKDLCTQDGKVYILDSGNSRIVITDEFFESAVTIDGFDNNGTADTFASPEGIFVDKNGRIYVADSGNGRVVILNADGTLYRAIGRPDSELLREDAVYTPIKIAVGDGGEIYVISRFFNEGVMEFTMDGEFRGFVGASKVTYSTWALIWKQLLTEEQAEKMINFVPTEYYSLDIDSQGFLYTVTQNFDYNTAIAGGGEFPVKRLNPYGDDVMVRRGFMPPVGDVTTAIDGKTSVFTDVSVSEWDTYSVLDTQYNRIFTYDFDGNLLCAFGGRGTAAGQFQKPVALEYMGEQLLVLDESAGAMSVFSLTEYGGLLTDAIRRYSEGDYEAAGESFREVRRQNLYSDLASIGLGKVAYYHEKDYASAMAYFKEGNNKTYYSMAFEKYTQQTFEQNFLFIVLGMVAAVAVIFGFFFFTGRYNKKEKTNLLGQLCYSNQVVMHPLKCFWDIKFEKRASVKVANCLLVLLILSFWLRSLCTGYLFTGWDVARVDLLGDALKIVGVVAAVIVSFWVASVLFDGIGRMKDIYIALMYSVVPLIYANVLQVAVSHFISLESASLYDIIFVFAMIWCAFLVFSFTVVFNDSRVGAAIGSLVVTVVVLGVLIFVLLLFFSMMQQILGFVSSLITEVRLRG